MLCSLLFLSEADLRHRNVLVICLFIINSVKISFCRDKIWPEGWSCNLLTYYQKLIISKFSILIKQTNNPFFLNFSYIGYTSRIMIILIFYDILIHNNAVKTSDLISSCFIYYHMQIWRKSICHRGNEHQLKVKWALVLTF